MYFNLVRFPFWRPRSARRALNAAIVEERKLLALRAYWLIEKLTSNLWIMAHLRADVIPHHRIALQKVKPVKLFFFRHNGRVSVVPDFSEQLEHLPVALEAAAVLVLPVVACLEALAA